MYLLEVDLFDELNTMSKYNILINVIDPYGDGSLKLPKNGTLIEEILEEEELLDGPIPTIFSIDPTGFCTVIFDRDVMVPENLTMINNGTIEILSLIHI